MTSTHNQSNTSFANVDANASEQHAGKYKMSKQLPTLQQFFADEKIDVSADEFKMIRRALRAKFKSTHAHRERWYASASVIAFLRKRFETTLFNRVIVDDADVSAN